MKYKQMALAGIIAGLVTLTGCNDDEIVFKTTPEDLESMAQMATEISDLKTSNQDLLAQNNALQVQVDNLGSGKFEAYDFETQCAEIGVAFDYQDPNMVELVKALPGSVAVRSTTCSDCHNYAGDETGVTIPHDDRGDCSDCHDAHTIVDPDAPLDDATLPTFIQPEFGAGVIDGVTGASGTSYYVSGSYLNAQWLKKQINTQRKNFRWLEATEEDTGVSTLADACALEDRQYLADMFPNDGESYVIHVKENAIGAKLVATVNKVSGTGNHSGSTTPNIATFGFGLEEQDDGDFYVNMFIGKNNTCYNIVMNGEARLSYYEYDPSQFEKTGLETLSRNRGARILVSTDYTKTGLFSFDWSTPVTGAEAGTAFAPADVDWSKVGSCNLVLKVENILPLG